MSRILLFLLSTALAACASADPESWPFDATPVAGFDEPWAMTFLPDGRLLITEKPGRLLLVSQDGSSSVVNDAFPELVYGGQGGLGDVVLHPDFAGNKLVYISYAEAGEGGLAGAAVVRARLHLDAAAGRLEDLEVIWRQAPKVTGRGHYGHRIAFSADGYLFISSGERQKFDPAQDMQANLGKILRLNDDGTVPSDNPFAGRGGVTAQIWTLGHRNPLGLAFDAGGRLWNHEMGPQHGDELNLVVRGENYGYPIVSNGDHYDGRVIPDHDTRPEFAAPKAYWVPSIAPAGFIIYSGDLFPGWKGNGFIGGLVSQSLVRIEFDGDLAREVERYSMGKRIREIEQGPDGSIWLLEDGKGGRLLRLAPKSN
ncbi:MAG TPA: PQQ-dependent sugar dehydrogenase [Woeseiaceae bacterium]|nr:PQQ-dependent sugar dehydrogenase [Woeseiaceae bacterium]